MATIDLDEVLAPIEGDNPSGADVSFEQIYEDIKEARRQDDPNLSQGDWKTDLKVAHWPKARELCIEVLARQSKDLQVAAWLAEASSQLKGFAGLADGLTVIERLLADFWDTVHPEAEGGDLELRIGRIAWLNRNLPLLVRFIPVTQEGGYGWHKWKESRDVDNLGRESQEAMQAAIAEGKIGAETFDKAVIATPAEFYEQLFADVTACTSAFDALVARLDERFGSEAPGLGDLGDAISDCVRLVKRMAADKGLLQGEDAAADEAVAEGEGGEVAAAGPARGGPAGPIASRGEALRRLTEVAEYFRRAEPHSPVSYLVDRAVRWGNMSLDQWLQEMVKDEAMLAGLRETLGVRPSAES